MDDEIPMNDGSDPTEQELRSISFMNHVIADFEAMREDPIAWEQYCDDFEAIDRTRPI